MPNFEGLTALLVAVPAVFSVGAPSRMFAILFPMGPELRVPMGQVADAIHRTQRMGKHRRRYQLAIHDWPPLQVRAPPQRPRGIYALAWPDSQQGILKRQAIAEW